MLRLEGHHKTEFSTKETELKSSRNTSDQAFTLLGELGRRFRALRLASDAARTILNRHLSSNEIELRDKSGRLVEALRKIEQLQDSLEASEDAKRSANQEISQSQVALEKLRKEVEQLKADLRELLQEHEKKNREPKMQVKAATSRSEQLIEKTQELETRNQELAESKQQFSNTNQ